MKRGDSRERDQVTVLVPSNSSRALDSTEASRATDFKPSWPQGCFRYQNTVLDVLSLVALLVLFGALEAAPTRKTFLIRTTLFKHSYPYAENSVPSWAVPVYSLGLPFVTFLAWKLGGWRRQVSWYDLWRTCVAFLFAVFLTAAITNCLKVAIGRPRPNFVFRCWPDGQVVLSDGNEFGGYAVCTTDAATEAEHRKSFPSGHSSWSASGLGFLTFWLLGQTGAFRGAGRSWPFLLSLLPALAAIVVGVSRITDYWHNVSDVCFGLGLGFFISMVAYFKVYPFWTNEFCDVPTYAHERERLIWRPKRSGLGMQASEGREGSTAVAGGQLPLAYASGRGFQEISTDA